MAKSPKKKAAPTTNERLIARKPQGAAQLHVLDALECGIVLVGQRGEEPPRGPHVARRGLWPREGDEVLLIGCDIPEYTQASRFNHKPNRPRKLLLHRREIKRFAKLATKKGLTLVPLRIYFKEGRAKVLLGICKGKASTTSARP